MSSHPNIPRLYVIKIAKWFMLYMPIVVLFYESNGLKMKDIMILQAVYSIVIVILEIPSGYLADVWGRKRAILLGVIMGVVGFSIYGLSYGFIGFLIAEIVLGIGQSCVSGADSAMLYDSLLENKKEKEYSRFEGKISSLGNLAEAAAALISILLVTHSLRTPYYGQILVAAIAIPAAITLKEPIRHKKLLNQNIREIVDISMFALFGNKVLRRNILFSAFTGCATLTMAWFAQKYFEHSKIDHIWFGLLWAALNITVAIASFFAYKIESKLGAKGSIILISLALPLGYLMLSISGIVLGLIILFLFYLVRGYATPILKDYINRITGSEVRATVLSVRNFIIRINFAIAGPLLGWANDMYDLPTALLLGGIIFLVLNTFAGILFLASRAKMNEPVHYTSRTSPS
ncbi:MAG: MFS transporter [Bacteroidales bacterium]|nr:MFS transporter [Bacteroidales bacterium]